MKIRTSNKNLVKKNKARQLFMKKDKIHFQNNCINKIKV